MELTTMDLPDGSRYEGEVNSAGRPHGRGTMKWDDARIVGEFREGKPHGHCVETWQNNGRRYVGEFREGRHYGRGVCTWPDGDCYEFIFCRFLRGGLIEGCGARTWPDGRRYVGEFRAGKPAEEGVMTWPDGTCFVGKFRDGEPAEGITTKPDGTMSPIREG